MKLRGLFLVFILAAFLSGCATQGAYKIDPAIESSIKTIGGTSYVPLLKVCDVYNIEWKWDNVANVAVLDKDGTRYALMAGTDTALVGGKERKLAGKVLMQDGAMMVPVSFVKNNFAYKKGQSTIQVRPQPAASGKFTINTIVLDPGHGGKAVGAVGRKLHLREKNLTLMMANRVREILESNGINVIMTRTSDKDVSLQSRAYLANSRAADLFVSIHCNASKSKNLKGFECYYLADTTDDNALALQAAENSALQFDPGIIGERTKSLNVTIWDLIITENRLESIELARQICRSVENSGIINNSGIKSARFYVLKFTRMPAVLVETGYLSNAVEEKKFRDEGFLEKMCQAVASGILAFKRDYERTEGFSAI